MGDEGKQDALLTLRKRDGEPILTVLRTGGVQYGEDADLDELARQFWHAIAGQQTVLAGMREKLVVFLCGPMANIPDGNRATFNGHAALLTNAGFQTVDPTQLEGFSPANPHEVNLRITMVALLQCSAVALLPGWQMSPAAVREVEIAGECGMVIAPVSYWLYTNPSDDG